MGPKLKDVKIGDKLAVWGPYGRDPRSIYTVARVTKTQVICKESETRWRISDGYAVGDNSSWGRSSVGVATDKHIATVRRYRLTEALTHIRESSLTDLDDEKLRAACEILGLHFGTIGD